jgi:hypothetical protein
MLLADELVKALGPQPVRQWRLLPGSTFPFMLEQGLGGGHI